jgi:hypothetical protein
MSVACRLVRQTLTSPYGKTAARSDLRFFGSAAMRRSASKPSSNPRFQRLLQSFPSICQDSLGLLTRLVGLRVIVSKIPRWQEN